VTMLCTAQLKIFKFITCERFQKHFYCIFRMTFAIFRMTFAKFFSK